MNTYKKYAPNVYVAQCTEPHEKGEIIEVESRRGSVKEHIVHNLVSTNNGNYYYSITRADGYNIQERARIKSEQRQQWAESADRKSEQYFTKSNEHHDFLCLGEPIKIGHHSERRHRRIIEQAQNNTRKSIEMDKKAEQHRRSANYWAGRENDINLSMPESLEYYSDLVERKREEHQHLKDHPEEREHSYSLTYAKKAVNEAEQNLRLAKRLWGTEEQQAEAKDELVAKKAKSRKMTINEKIDAFKDKFFAFNTDQLKSGMEQLGLGELDYDKVCHVGSGCYVLKSRADEFVDLFK